MDLSKEQLENAQEWIEEGKMLEDWCRVNGISAEHKEDVIEQIMSNDAPAPVHKSTPVYTPVVKDTLDDLEDED